jgi:DNA-directed RNA polymerase subunit RPC12/RpoP
MNKVVGALITFAGICMILLGAVFLIALGVETAITGAALVVIGAGIMYYVYRVEKIEASKPKLLSQTFNVSMSGSGTMVPKDMVCKSCGAPISDKDVKAVQGGLMAKCPYCGVVFALQEAPKW